MKLIDVLIKDITLFKCSKEIINDIDISLSNEDIEILNVIKIKIKNKLDLTNSEIKFYNSLISRINSTIEEYNLCLVSFDNDSSDIPIMRNYMLMMIGV